MYVVCIIWLWSNRAGRRYKISRITESWIILNGQNYNFSFEERLNITVQEKYIHSSSKETQTCNVPWTPSENEFASFIFNMNINIINLGRIFTLCLNVRGGRLCNLKETEDLFIFILRFGGVSFRQSFIWNTITCEGPSTRKEIHG